MNKEKVCVKLTRKNPKKVLGILEMFGEKMFHNTRFNLEQGNHLNGGYPFVYWNGHYWVGRQHGEDLTLIKPRELRNILAKEHLKEGDICVFKQRGKEHIYRVDKIGDGNYPYIHNEKHNVAICFDNFLRYATDEEKALLEPKAEFGVDEFEVGDWYISKNGTIFNYQEYHCYGWLRGEWNDCNWSWTDTYDVRKATEREVIEALKKECVKRGLVSGVYIASPWMDGVSDDKLEGDYEYRPESNQLVIVHRVSYKHAIIYSLFKDGKWAEPLKEPETYTREVWVNHYSDQEFHVHYNKEIAELHSRINKGFGRDAQTVKATLTYDIPMTKV